MTARGDVAPTMVKSWTTTEGLPQNSVQAIAQTPDGYLWLGTRGGLSRFDGVRFTNYGLRDGLKNLNVRVLTGDGEGGLWIATAGGLSRWRNGVITTWTTADGLLHNEIYSLAAAGPGAVWVGSRLGLQHFGADGFRSVGEGEELRGMVVTLATVTAGELGVSMEQVGLFLDGATHRHRRPALRGVERASSHQPRRQGGERRSGFLEAHPDRSPFGGIGRTITPATPWPLRLGRRGKTFPQSRRCEK